MSNTKTKESPKQRRTLKRIGKIAAVGLGLFLLIAVGAVLWLRSSSGAAFVYGQAVKALAAAGYTLEAESMEGPLPGRLRLTGLSVADGRGPIARAEMAEVRLAPLALLRGQAHVSLIDLRAPELLRLPPASEKAEEEKSGEFSLPVDIKVDRINIQDGRLAPGALAGAGLDSDEIKFRAEGRAEIGRAAARAHLVVEADEKDHRLLSLALDLGENGGRDSLSLALNIDDRPDGFLSRLLADPAWPGLALTFKGDGPLDQWRGEMDLNSPRFGALKAELNLAGTAGRLWPDLINRPDWQAALTAKVSPSPEFQGLGRGAVGEDLSLVADVAMIKNKIAADLALGLGGSPNLILSSQAAGTLADGGGDFSLKVLLEGLSAADNPGEDLPLALTADLTVKADRLALENLQLGGRGLDLTGEFERRAAGGDLKAALDFQLTKDSPLLAELLALAGLGRDYFAGELALKADLDWIASSGAAQGRFDLSGRDLLWPGASLQKTLGPELKLTADLSGGQGGPLNLEIKEGRAGLLSLAGQASATLAETFEETLFDLKIAAGAEDLSPLVPALSGPLNLKVDGRGRPAELSAAVDLSSPEIILGSGAVKNLSVAMSALGGLKADGEGPGRPDFSGELKLNAADSPGGPLSFSSNWRVNDSGSGLLASLSDLAGDLAGLNLAGQLNVDLQGDRPGLDGALSAKIDAWEKMAALVGQPISGRPASFDLTLSAPGGRQAAVLSLQAPQINLGQGKDRLLSIQKASVDFKGDDLFGRPDLDLDLKLASGLAGPAAWQSGAIESRAQGGRGDFAVDLKGLRLAGAGGGGRDGLKLNGLYDLTDPVTVTVNGLDLILAGGGLTVKEPVTVGLGDTLTISDFALNFRPGGRLAGKVDLTPGQMTIQAKGEKIPFKAVKPFVSADIPEGELQSLTVALNQGAEGLSGRFDLKTSASVQKFKPVLNINGELLGGARPALKIEGSINGGPGWKADGDFKAALPLTAGADGGAPQPDMNGPLSGEIKFTGPLAPLWALAGQPDRALSGLARLEAQIGGTLAKPAPRGVLYVAGGRYEDSVLGLLIADITLEARSTPEAPLAALLSAKDGKGGGLALEAKVASLTNPSLSAKGRMSRFSPTHRDDAVVYISGDFGAEGPFDRLSLTSDLTVDHGELDLKIAFAGGSVPTLPISNLGDKALESSRGMRTNLKINIPGRFFIRGSGLESEWRGNLTVSGSTGRPSLVGQIVPVRGYFTFAAKEFQFSGGDISFSGGTTPNLNLELTNNTPGLTAILRFGGTASKPSLTMESRPPYPEEEVLSHVLFGKSASTISRFEALQLASAINGLRDFGSDGFNALGTVRASLGLDVLRLGGANDDRERRASNMSGSMAQDMTGGGSSADGEQSDDITVEAGKYIADNVYVGVEHSGVGGPAVRLEVELRPSVSLEARTSTESSRIGLGWKKDY